jgi:hypothetical protein
MLLLQIRSLKVLVHLISKKSTQYLNLRFKIVKPKIYSIDFLGGFFVIVSIYGEKIKRKIKKGVPISEDTLSFYSGFLKNINF